MSSQSAKIEIPGSQSFMIPGSNYGYTGMPVENLTSFTNTVAVGLLDESGSTSPFKTQMDNCCKEIVKSLRHSSVADNLIYRQCHFGTNFREHHGYTPLSQLNESMYDGCYQSGGQTMLYDSIVRVINETLHYADLQAQNHYRCNGIIYIITDGADYKSMLNQSDVKDALAKAVSSESLESLMTILIGVNDNSTIQDELRKFQQNVGITQFEFIDTADEKKLARVANLISRSVISQSQHVNSGGPSQTLQF